MTMTSGDMLRQEYIETLGEQFGKEYHAVWTEWVSGLIRYEEQRELFGNQEKCDLLNAVAPGFFGDIQNLFWRDLMLHCTRLTDKSAKALRLRGLERYIEDEGLLAEVTRHREAATIAAAPITDWRNREIAHRDKARVTSESSRPLASVKLKTCKQVLDHVHAALNAIELHYRRGTMANMVSYNPGSGALVAHLKGLVDSVQFAASLINPEDPTAGVIPAKGRAFLQALGRPEGSVDINGVYEIMDMARRCRIRREDSK